MMRQISVWLSLIFAFLSAASATAQGPAPDMDPYYADLKRRVTRAWFPPQTDTRNYVAVVFKIHTNGTISILRLVTSSGMGVSDLAALKAIQNAAPFRPLPDGAPSDIDLTIGFNYEPENGFKRFGVPPTGITVTPFVKKPELPANSETASEGQPASKEPKPTFFTLGSSMKDVLALQGTPTAVMGDTWMYGSSNDRIQRWQGLWLHQ